MQLTYFFVNKVVQWYNCGKTVLFLYKQTEVPDRLTAGEKICTREKSKASLYVRKRSGKNVTI